MKITAVGSPTAVILNYMISNLLKYPHYENYKGYLRQYSPAIKVMEEFRSPVTGARRIVYEETQIEYKEKYVKKWEAEFNNQGLVHHRIESDSYGCREIKFTYRNNLIYRIYLNDKLNINYSFKDEDLIKTIVRPWSFKNRAVEKWKYSHNSITSINKHYKYVSTFRDDNQIESLTGYYRSGKLESEKSFYYDMLNRLDRIESFQYENGLRKRDDLFRVQLIYLDGFDDFVEERHFLNNRIEQISFRRTAQELIERNLGFENEVHEEIFDQNGNAKLRTYYRAEDNSIIERFTTNYKYDKKGNWIEKITSDEQDKIIETILREIEY